VFLKYTDESTVLIAMSTDGVMRTDLPPRAACAIQHPGEAAAYCPPSKQKGGMTTNLEEDDWSCDIDSVEQDFSGNVYWSTRTTARERRPTRR
jgi:hypothetical protein